MLPRPPYPAALQGKVSRNLSEAEQRESVSKQGNSSLPCPKFTLLLIRRTPLKISQGSFTNAMALNVFPPCTTTRKRPTTISTSFLASESCLQSRILRLLQETFSLMKTEKGVAPRKR